MMAEMLSGQTFQVQRDPHPVRCAAAEITVQFHEKISRILFSTALVAALTLSGL
jgi:hypothetical protein